MNTALLTSKANRTNANRLLIENETRAGLLAHWQRLLSDPNTKESTETTMALVKPTKTLGKAAATTTPAKGALPGKGAKKPPVEEETEEEEEEDEEEEAPPKKVAAGKGKTAASAVDASEHVIEGVPMKGLLGGLLRRLTLAEIVLNAYSPELISLDDNGALVLDLDNAKLPTLRAWAYQFLKMKPADILKAKTTDLEGAFAKAQKAKDFAGWEFGEGRWATLTRTLPELDGTSTTWADVASASAGKKAAETELPKAGPTKPPKKAEKEEEGIDLDKILKSGNITIDLIEKANWSQLVEIAEFVELDYETLCGGAQKPKVLRAALIEALSADETEEEETEEAEETEEEEADEEEEESAYAAGTPVYVLDGGKKVYGKLTGAADDDGDPEIEWPSGETAFFPAADVHEGAAPKAKK